MQDDGNAMDATSLAILVSLFYFQWSGNAKRLSLKYMPVTTTFAIFPNDRYESFRYLLDRFTVLQITKF